MGKWKFQGKKGKKKEKQIQKKSTIKEEGKENQISFLMLYHRLDRQKRVEEEGAKEVDK